MADMFGEVVHPSSRAFWNEGEDDNQGERESLTFVIDWSEELPEKVKTLVVAETHLVTGFLKEYAVKDAKCVGTIKSQHEKEPSTIYKLSDELFMCLVDAQVDLSVAGDFIEAILPILSKSENIVAITCNHVSQLKCPITTSETSFMRLLSTRSAPEQYKKFAPTLEQPNIVAGVAAGAIAHAEATSSSGTLAILYIDGFELDSSSAEPLIKFLSDILHLTLKPLHLTSHAFFSKGNLYI